MLPPRQHPLLNHFIHHFNAIHHGSEHDEKLNQIEEELEKHFKQRDLTDGLVAIDECLSCLSPAVSKLVHKDEARNEDYSIGNYFNEQTGLLIVDDDATGFPFLQVSDESFLQSSITLREICSKSWNVGIKLDSVLLPEFDQPIIAKQVAQYLKNTKQPLTSLEYLQQIYHQDSINIYAIFSFVSTLVEHLMTSVVYCVTFYENAATIDQMVIPQTLTEILECPQVKQVIPIKLLNVIKVFMGPPKGLNLRNVLYHGFLDETEIHPCYLSFLWRIYLTSCQCVDQYVTKKGWTEFIPKPRTDMTDPSMYCDLLDYQRAGTDEPIILFKSHPSDEEIIKQTLDQTYFIVPTRRRIINSALGFLRRGLLKESQVDLQLSLCLLFPQFEFLLRRIYIATNESVDERTWAAQNEEFFSTLDVIFSNHLEDTINTITEPSARVNATNESKLTPNELYTVLKNNLGDTLLDSFMYYRVSIELE